MEDDPHLSPPPQAIGHEKSILSCMLADPVNLLPTAIERQLTAEHFYLPAHRTIFRVLCDNADEGKALDLVSLSQQLGDMGVLDEIGGNAYIYELFNYAPTSGHFDNHLEVVREKFLLRRVVDVCTACVTEAMAAPSETSEFLDSVEARVFAIRDGMLESGKPSKAQTIDQVLEELGNTFRRETTHEGMVTGYVDLDNKLGGLEPGDMFIIAGRPSMGKTSLGMNIVEHVCLDQGQPCLVFSCEMTEKQLIKRLIYSRAGFSRAAYKPGERPTKQTLQRIKNASEAVAAAPLFIDDTPGISIAELRAKARRYKRQHDIKLIAIDYIQLMRSNTRQAENAREREIGQISAGLKGIAKELLVPVIVLAQLNRGPETRTGRNHGLPRMADLRESGTMEQDADQIGLLYRPAYYAENSYKAEALAGQAKLILTKNRNGPTGEIDLAFLDHLMRFESCAHTPEPAPEP